MTSAVSSLGSSQVQAEITAVEARLEAPITQLNNQVATDKADISAWGAIQGKISSLSTALTGISDLSTINKISATSTTSTVATATASSGAQAGTYNLVVKNLATSQEIYSSAQGNASASLGAGSGKLTFNLGSLGPSGKLSSGTTLKTETVSIAKGSMTLNGIAQAINSVNNGGVRASIIGSGSSAHLVLQGSGTGKANAFTVTGSGSALAKFDYSGSGSAGKMTTEQKAKNASATINGVPVSAATNTLGSAISKVSLTLNGTGSSTVSVSSSTTGLAGALSSVASTLNAAISSISKETAYVAPSSASSAKSSSSSTKSGPLLGNFTADDMSNQLLTAISGAAASGVSANALGFTVSKTGAVSFSSSTFATAYAANPTAAQNLITQIYKNLDGVTTGALGATGSNGTLNAETTSLQSTITSINSQVTEMTKIDAAQLNILSEQYSAAEATSSTAQVSAAYLSIFTGAGSGSSSKG